MLWIVSGPSSAGKSSFLSSPLAQEITGLPTTTRILFPSDLVAGAYPSLENVFLHYNILHGLKRLGFLGNSSEGKEYDLRQSWSKILDIPVQKSAVVLLVSRATLIARVQSRTRVEPHLSNEYKKDKWLRVYESIDLDALYAAWLSELKRRAIPCVEVDGTSIDGWIQSSV